MSLINQTSNSTLVLNCGSSSLKYALISEDNSVRIEGLAEGLGLESARIKHTDLTGDKQVINLPNADHKVALTKVLELIEDYKPVAVGHRVVHGGNKFAKAQVITQEIMDTLKALIPLAPLHNPANILGIEGVTEIYPDLPQVAVFDTAFHQTMPEKAYRYAIPKALYEEDNIRRYGFHGTSHAYVSDRASEITTAEGNNLQRHGWLTAHLGNGCSTTAIYDGKSLDSSMGLTPLEGLMMGTRSGDVDPGLHVHLHRSKGWSIEEIDTMLNKKSGLLGVSGISNDMREIEEVADNDNHPYRSDAKLALDMFAYRVSRSLASLSCALPELTGIVFTGGIGENGVKIREAVITNLQHFGIKMDTKKNAELIRGAEGSFHIEGADGSAVELWVIPTDEEFRIAQETTAVLAK